MKGTPAYHLAILGPTASGKTAYAIDIAQRINGAIISADSRQVYAGMNIGTAKPAEAHASTAHTPDIADIIGGIPHYLINVATVTTPYTLSDWLRDTAIAYDAITASGRTPIIAGGTMLYIDALVDGYDVPDIAPNPQLRASLEQEQPETLYTKLKQLDPEACSFIEPHNTRRIIRALEVIDATHEKFSTLRQAAAPKHATTRIGIFPDWDIMRANITQRSHTMIAQGLVAEATALREQFPQSPLLQTINYTEALSLADGALTEDKAITKMTQSTLRYAHRQMSWWNRRNDIGWITVASSA